MLSLQLIAARILIPISNPAMELIRKSSECGGQQVLENKLKEYLEADCIKCVPNLLHAGE